MIDALVIDGDGDRRLLVATALRVDRRFRVRYAGPAALPDLLCDGDGGRSRFDLIVIATAANEIDAMLVNAIRHAPGCDRVPIVLLTDGPGAEDPACAVAVDRSIALPFDPIGFPRELAELAEAVS